MDKKIIRTKTRAEGGITPEEKEKMDKISRKWIGIAFRTDPIDPSKIIPAIERLYACAGLKKPRVVIVPSPCVMAFAYGASAWIWYCRKNASTLDATRAATLSATLSATRDATDAATDAATRAATYVATRDATDFATRVATDVATYDATRAATDAATYAATDDATLSATRAATDDATDDATDAATRAATDDATRVATDVATYDATRAAAACFSIAGTGGLECAKKWGYVYQGGNMWAAFPSFVEACRDVLGLDLPEFSAWSAWEECVKEGGFRVLHEEFCIVSDFPEFIRINELHQPHCDNGPSHRWRDGWELYHLNGIPVPKEVVMTPADRLDPKIIVSEKNVDVRREIIRKIGIERCLELLDSKILDEKGDYQLVSIDLGMEKRSVGLKMKNPSIGVWHLEFVPFATRTVQDAINFRKGRLQHHHGDWNPSILT